MEANCPNITIAKLLTGTLSINSNQLKFKTFIVTVVQMLAYAHTSFGFGFKKMLRSNLVFDTSSVNL